VNRKQPPSDKSSIQFWLLSSFIVLTFLVGGSSRIDVQSLAILRPASVLFCALALLTLRRSHFEGRKLFLLGFAAFAALASLHLIPLPPAIWQNLAGRELLVEIDRAAGLEGVWRPLTITPMNGWHALASLATPLAVLLFGVQLSRNDLFRMLPLVVFLGAISGLFGVLQIAGGTSSSLYTYRITNNGAAVGLFANRNHAAVLLACMFPMLAVFTSVGGNASNQQQGRQLIALGLAIILVPLILVTGSRAGLILAVLGFGGALLLYKAPNDGSAINRSRSTSRALPYILLGSISAFGVGGLTILFSRAEAFERLFHQSSFEDGRGDFWTAVINITYKYFPIGAGSGSFVEAYQVDEPSQLLFVSYLNRAHNDWLETAMSFGLPGIILMLGVAVAFCLHAFKIWRHGKSDRQSIKMAKLATVILAILALASFADYPLRTPIMMSFAMIAGLWLVEWNRSAQKTEQSPEEPQRPKTKRSNYLRIMETIRTTGLLRITIVSFVAIIGSWSAFALAVSGITRIKNPARALTFVSFESTALAARSDQLLFSSLQNPPKESYQMALAALRNQAVNARALRIVGFYLEAKGDSDRAARLIKYAAKLSRREPGAQIWQIERSAREGTTAETLEHFDILLRTKPDTSTLLFPRLMGAIDDAEVRAGLVPYVKLNRSWISSFLNLAILQAKNPSSLVELIVASGGLPKTSFAKSQGEQLIARLINEKQYSAAHRLYLTLPGAKASRLTNAAFDNTDLDGRFADLGWSVVNEPNAGAALDRKAGQDHPVLSLFVDSTTTRVVAKKMLYLKPASYRFHTKLAAIRQDRGSILKWRLRCPSLEGAPIVWNANFDSKTLIADLNVPSKCPVQFLELEASGGDGKAGLEATIAYVRIGNN
jgi:O-antigen ligase